MSRSYKCYKRWPAPGMKKGLKHDNKRKHRSLERQAIIRFRKGENTDITVRNYMYCEDVWGFCQEKFSQILKHDDRSELPQNDVYGETWVNSGHGEMTEWPKVTVC